jgi:hypothetical protein
LVVLGLKSGLHTCSVGVLPREPHPLPFFAPVIFQVGSQVFAQGQPQILTLLPC